MSPFRRHYTRRSLLQATCVAFAAGFTALADTLDRWMRWCSFTGDLRYAGAG